jgi:hypothetical protein
MTSLKAFVPRLSDLLNVSPDGLYERQRAMVGAKLLTGLSGRGPGRGVRATPESVAMLLIAVMATDGISDLEARVRELAALRSEPLEYFGRARTFKAAITNILGSDESAALVKKIRVFRTYRAASIDLNLPPSDEVDFVDFGKSRFSYGGGFWVTAEFDASAIKQVRSLLRELEQGDESS